MYKPEEIVNEAARKKISHNSTIDKRIYQPAGVMSIKTKHPTHNRTAKIFMVL
jgi:hypothetical protein